MIVAYSSHCMGPMAVPPHHQTCSASQCKKFGPKWGLLTWFAMCWIRSRKLQKTQFSLVPRLCLDDSTQTKPPACPHGVGGWSPRCRIAWNGLHHPRESILAPIDVLGNLDLKNVWWILVLNKCMGRILNCSPAVLNDKERWLKVSDGAMRPRQKFRVARSCTMVSMIFCVVSTLENYYKSKFDLSWVPYL